MSLHAALAAASMLVSLAFALSTCERWLEGRKPQEAAWTAALLLFAAGSAALWIAAWAGWSPWTFRAFYLFGAVIDVPVLALGTVYLLAPRRIADRVTTCVVAGAAFAAGAVVVAPLQPLGRAAIPQGSKVFGALPRALAAVGSGAASLVIFGGAVFSAWRLWRVRRAEPAAGSGAPLPPARLAGANVLIAAGTLVLGAGGLLNSVADQMDGFSISLLAGVTLLFAGFLLTNPSAGRSGAGRGEAGRQDTGSGQAGAESLNGPGGDGGNGARSLQGAAQDLPTHSLR